MKQRSVKPFLKSAHKLANCRSRHIELARGSRKATCLALASKARGALR